MTGSSRGPWLTDPLAGPPRKSATSHPGQQARISTQSVSQHRLAQAAKSSARSYRGLPLVMWEIRFTGWLGLLRALYEVTGAADAGGPAGGKGGGAGLATARPAEGH